MANLCQRLPTVLCLLLLFLFCFNPFQPIATEFVINLQLFDDDEHFRLLSSRPVSQSVSQPSRWMAQRHDMLSRWWFIINQQEELRNNWMKLIKANFCFAWNLHNLLYLEINISFEDLLFFIILLSHFCVLMSDSRVVLLAFEFLIRQQRPRMIMTKKDTRKGLPVHNSSSFEFNILIHPLMVIMITPVRLAPPRLGLDNKRWRRRRRRATGRSTNPTRAKLGAIKSEMWKHFFFPLIRLP